MASNMKSARPSDTFLCDTCAAASTEQDMLNTASEAGHPSCLDALLKAGGLITAAEQGDVKYEDAMKVVPLIKAAENGYENCVEMLIHAGAVVNRANTYGSTALMAAA